MSNSATTPQVRSQEISLQWCVEDPTGHLLQSIDLSAFSIAPRTDRRNAWLQDALDGLADWNRETYQSICDYTSTLVWLKLHTPADSTALFSSTSFYEIPHWTFVTDLVMYCVAPDIVFATPSNYAFRENLFHESLHQRLCDIIKTDGIFTGAAPRIALPTIWIPWRQTSWGLEHALQAAFVYAHLMPLRIREHERLSPHDANRSVFFQAINTASTALRILRNGLMSHRALFNVSGQMIVDQIDTAYRTADPTTRPKGGENHGKLGHPTPSQ